jgi:hypothetical protein
MRDAFTWLPLCLLSIALSLGCGSTPKASTSNERLSIERLYPLRPGSVWTYDVDTGEGLPTLAITRVVARHGDQVEVSTGSESILYQLRPDGLFRPDLDSYVLRQPVQKGARWETRDGASAEISDVAKQASGPAGEFQGCVEVRESGGTNQKQVRTVFCPDVGPVEIESSLQIVLTGQSARVVARLRGYDFSGALGAAAEASAPATP